MERKNKQNFHVVNLNNYVRPNSVCQIQENGTYITNDLDRKKGKNFNYGENSYFYYIQDRYVGSVANAAIIESYAKYIYGKGLKTKSDIDLNKIIKKSDMRLICLDLVMQGAFAVKIIYSKDKSIITNIIHRPVSSIAIVNQEDLTEPIQNYVYCYDWRAKSKFAPVVVPAFGTVGSGEELGYFKIPDLVNPIFSLPSYQSGLQFVEMEEELSNFFNNHVKNRFQDGVIININQGLSVDSDEAQEEAEKAIMAKFTGTSQAAPLVISFNENKDNATTVTNLVTTDPYQQYSWLTEYTKDQIMMSHKVVNPILFGAKDSTGFSNNADEMVVALKTLYRSQINPLREIIIDGLEEILNFNGADIQLEFEEIDELQIKEEAPAITPDALESLRQEFKELRQHFASTPPYHDDCKCVDGEDNPNACDYCKKMMNK